MKNKLLLLIPLISISGLVAMNPFRAKETIFSMHVNDAFHQALPVGAVILSKESWGKYKTILAGSIGDEGFVAIYNDNVQGLDTNFNNTGIKFFSNISVSKGVDSSNPPTSRSITRAALRSPTKIGVIEIRKFLDKKPEEWLYNLHTNGSIETSDIIKREKLDTLTEEDED